jgi:hypothetical protein
MARSLITAWSLINSEIFTAPPFMEAPTTTDRSTSSRPELLPAAVRHGLPTGGVDLGIKAKRNNPFFDRFSRAWRP